MVNSWRGLIVCRTACILYQPLELLISKRRKTFPALVHNRNRQIVWNDLRRFSSFPKNLNRACSKVQLTEHLPNHLEKFCIQKGVSPWEKFSTRNHNNHWKYLIIDCMSDSIRILSVLLQVSSFLSNYNFLKYRL